MKMQSIRIILGRALQQTLVVLGLICLLSVGTLWLPMAQPTYAAATANQPLTPEEKVDQTYGYVESTGSREAGYEKAKEAAKDLRTEEQTYKRNLQTYKQEQPDTGLVEGAKDLIEKVTGGS
jgi:hypothetical protein